MAEPLPKDGGEHGHAEVPRKSPKTVSDPLSVGQSDQCDDGEDERHERWRLLRRVCHLRETVPGKASELLKATENYKFKAAAYHSYPEEEMQRKLQEYVENSEEKLQVPNWKEVREMIAEEKEDKPLVFDQEKSQTEFESLMQRVRRLKESQKELDRATAVLMGTPREISSVRETPEVFIEDVDRVIQETSGPTD